MGFFDDAFELPHELTPPKPMKGNQWGAESIDQILAWLEANPKLYAKKVILLGCGAEADDWELAIKELLEDEFVETKVLDGISCFKAAE